MRDATQRDLALLSAISKDSQITQRHLASEMGVALSLTNLYLKRLAMRGLVKIVNVKPNRLRYLLTPKGIAEKSRLVYEYTKYSLQRYREARQALRVALRPLAESGDKRVAFYGTGEAAEVAYLCLKEFGLELSAVFDPEDRQPFLGVAVRDPEDIRSVDFDRIVVTTFLSLKKTEAKIQELIHRGVSREKIVALRGDTPPTQSAS